ncbi:MAG: hypothetical protein WC450_02755 [Candidatus Omnitrophota bacterium]|jgi:hypothetical protein
MIRPAEFNKLWRIKLLIVIVLSWMTFLLFFRLGHDALWDDEAICALFGRTLFQTGDTSALHGHNIIAFNDGRELDDLRQRYVPPLQFYIVAPFAGVTHNSAFAVRFPFALCGLAIVAWVLYWLWEAKASFNTWLLVSLGFMGNVSFILFSRQCRYYAPMMLFSVLLTYLYLNKGGSPKKIWIMAAVAIMLLASNYLAYSAVIACGVVHYLIWGKKSHPFSRSEGIIFSLTQFLIGGIIVSIYNPLGKDVWDYSGRSWFTERLLLFWWNLRDLNTCEMGVGVLIALAPLLYFLKKDRRFIEAPGIIFTYILTVAIFSPQPVEQMSVAFVRYLCPLIPLCIFTEVIVIQALTARTSWLAFPLAFLFFMTNIMHGGPLAQYPDGTSFSHVIQKSPWRSTILEFLREQTTPREGPYQMTADWINKNVRKGESVLAVPGYTVYPLMFHAPHAVYAWQLAGDDPDQQFQNLPDIHFRGRSFPDYIIAFGPSVIDVSGLLDTRDVQGVRYNAVEHLNIYWADLSRPELFWHSFLLPQGYNPDTESIVIYKKALR